jgi:hypothetical protein
MLNLTNLYVDFLQSDMSDAAMISQQRPDARRRPGVRTSPAPLRVEIVELSPVIYRRTITTTRR